MHWPFIRRIAGDADASEKNGSKQLLGPGRRQLDHPSRCRQKWNDARVDPEAPNPEKRNEAHPRLLELMEETHGIIVYQEDVIKVAHYICGAHTRGSG